ncbi:hypothetical protein [Leptospira wolffii]|nr:hypothetical protein [Leptospira wolffii]EPG67514.1 putative lipoprotein [Leptospira wolffii serovar Khorat str. Khorat-H2]
MRPSHTIVLLSVLGFLAGSCKGNILGQMENLKKEGKFLELALLCQEHPESEYKEICGEAWSQASDQIDRILSEQASLPFLRVSVDEATRKKVEDLLSKNPELKEKYLPLWKKFVQ